MSERPNRVLAGIPDGAHLRQLMHFLAVARAGGFRKASALAGVQQPTLSKSVHALEAHYDRALFVRQPRGLTLTDFGRALLRRCEAIESLVTTPLVDKASALEGDVRIATQEHVATYLLPRFVAALRQRHPRLSVRITTGAAELLLPGLERGIHDFALLFWYPEANAFTRRSMGRFVCQVVVASDRANDPDVLRCFIGSREIDDAGSRAFPTLEHLRKTRPDTRIMISSSSLEAHRAMVLAGCGVSILPRFLVDDDLEAGRLQLVDPEYTYGARLDLLRYQGRRPTPQANATLELLDALGLSA